MPEIDENGLLISSFDYYHKSMHRIDKIYLMKNTHLSKVNKAG